MHPGYGDSAAEEFVARVQELGRLSTRTEADQVTRATMTALAERISSGEMRDLTSGIPDGLRAEIKPASGQAQPFDKNAFIDTITGGIGTVDMDRAENQTRAVLRTVHEWAPAGEIDNTVAQLPPKLADMFT